MARYYTAKCDLASSGRSERSWEDLQPLIAGRPIFDNLLKGSDKRFTKVFGARYPLTAEQDLMCVNSTTSANFIAMNALAAPGEAIAIETPVYDPIPVVGGSCGRKVIPFARIPERDFALDFASLRVALQAGAKLVVVTNLHNPSGASLTEQDLKHLHELAVEFDVPCLVDEVYIEFLPDWRERTALRHGDHFIISASLTKVYGLSELACGWIAGHRDIISICRQFFALYSYHNSSPGIEMACILSEHFDRFFASDRPLIDRNRDKLRALCATSDFRALFYEHSPIVLVELPKGVDDRAFCDHAFDAHGLFLTPGSFFGLGGKIRVGLFKKPEAFDRGLELLQATWASLPR
jgi:aspartate/methionine/tyrosine aminotransferase